MKLHKFSLFFITLCLLVYSVTVKANSLWEYTVHIEEKTDSFNLARNEAIKINRKIALENVISKLITLNDFRIVSKLLDNGSSYFFEDKIRLLNESFINNYYSVDITYYFNKDKILSFLNKNSIPYTNSLNNKVLFIPLNNDNIVYNGLWYKIWEKIEQNEYLTKIVLLDNLTNIDKAKIIEKDKEYLISLKNTYKVDNVIIANLIDNPSNSTPSDNKSIYTYTLNLVNLNDNTYQNFDNILSLYEALKYSVGFSELDVKNKTLDNIERKNFLTFKVQYNSFIDWIAIYNYIKQLPQIEELYLSELDDKNVIIKIKYQGDLDKIIEGAATHNIIIDPSEFSITCKGFCF